MRVAHLSGTGNVLSETPVELGAETGTAGREVVSDVAGVDGTETSTAPGLVTTWDRRKALRKSS